MWKAFKLWYQITWQGKEFVVNNSNGKIHHYTCEWCDNIKDFKRITNRERLALIEKNHSSMASCCVNKFVI